MNKFKKKMKIMILLKNIKHLINHWNALKMTEMKRLNHWKNKKSQMKKYLEKKLEMQNN